MRCPDFVRDISIPEEGKEGEKGKEEKASE